VGTDANVLFWVTVAVVAPSSVWVLGNVGFPEWPKSTALDQVVWERDRVLAVAKGTAGSAAGFLSALIVALLEREIKAEVPGIAVLGCLLGAVGLLLFAAKMSVSVRLGKATGAPLR
jgi:hypothetical protein